MAPFCPKCHRALAGGQICCADIRYMWRCRKCFKLSVGFAIPYARCPLCDGELQVFADGESRDAARAGAIREAMQAVLDRYLFYKLARDQSRHWDQRAVMERLCEAEMALLHKLEQDYHPHLEPQVLEPPLAEQDRLGQRLFRGICLSDHSAVCDLYHAATQMERRSRDHLGALASELPDCAERETLAALAAEADQHLALLDSEMALVAQSPALEALSR
jgi:hypothetical protein